MTPDDIKSQRFGVRLLRGLRPEEVSAFLEDVADAYGDVQKWNTELMDRVESLQNELRALQRVARRPRRPQISRRSGVRPCAKSRRWCTMLRAARRR